MLHESIALKTCHGHTQSVSFYTEVLRHHVHVMSHYASHLFVIYALLCTFTFTLTPILKTFSLTCTVIQLHMNETAILNLKMSNCVKIFNKIADTIVKVVLIVGLFASEKRKCACIVNFLPSL